MSGGGFDWGVPRRAFRSPGSSNAHFSESKNNPSSNALFRVQSRAERRGISAKFPEAVNTINFFNPLSA
jgi:hypothetical protein